METLLYFALWGGAIFLLMRLGCGAHVMGHGQGRAREEGRDDSSEGAATDLRWVAPRKDTDPVCGKTVATANAKPSVYDGYVYYFCSRECREVFEAAPDIYAPGQNHRRARELGHDHG